MDYRKKLAEFFSTVFYIGKIKYAPGTFGSLPAFPLCYLIMHFTVNNKIVFPIPSLNPGEQQLLGVLLINLLVTILLFIAGTYATSIYISGSDNQDPREVVIDETVGQMLTIILSSFSAIFIYNSSISEFFSSTTTDLIFLLFLPFLSFRLFDIMKPWPINWLDKNLKGAIGVMVDDIAAAIFASVTQYVIVFILIDLFPIKIIA